MDRTDPEEELSGRRFHCEVLATEGEEISLDAHALAHAKVLRLSAGDAVVLFDGRGAQCTARVLELQRRLRCVVLGPRTERPRRARVGLVLCVPKAHKLEDIVRMTTEVGVAEIVLAISERCVVRLREDRDAHKIDRLHRVAVEAARQSEQAYVPELHAPQPLEAALRNLSCIGQRIALIERSEAPLEVDDAADAIWIAVGPEGGFSPRDRAMLISAGFQPGGLGPSILRTETAAVVGVGLAMDRLARLR